jgi:hypothetical protein
MVVNTPPGGEVGSRKLGPVSWIHDGCRTLSIHARQDVPSFDDSMIRSALVRGALACRRLAILDRTVNRELWALGYVARIERDLTDRSVVTVEIASGR